MPTYQRAQAAMEYLLTYGWAIAAVMVIGAAFWSLGAFSEPGGTMSAVGFTFFKLMPAASSSKDGLMVLVFQNTLPYPITINATNSTVVDGLTNKTCKTRVFIPEQVPNGGQIRVEVMDCMTPNREDYKLDLKIPYTANLGGAAQSRSETGSIWGRQSVTPHTGCMDTDNRNYYIKGYACWEKGCFSDYCVENNHPSAEGSKLIEQFCAFGIWFSQDSKDCPCYDGVCLT